MNGRTDCHSTILRTEVVNFLNGPVFCSPCTNRSRHGCRQVAGGLRAVPRDVAPACDGRAPANEHLPTSGDRSDAAGAQDGEVVTNGPQACHRRQHRHVGGSERRT